MSGLKSVSLLFACFLFSYFLISVMIVLCPIFSTIHGWNKPNQSKINQVICNSLESKPHLSFMQCYTAPHCIPKSEVSPDCLIFGVVNVSNVFNKFEQVCMFQWLHQWCTHNSSAVWPPKWNLGFLNSVFHIKVCFLSPNPRISMFYFLLLCHRFPLRRKEMTTAIYLLHLSSG